MKHLVLFSCLLLLANCSKNDPVTPTPAVVFTGYTGRDASGTLTAPNDPTDWTLDATWTGAETGLFSKYNLSFSQPALAASTWQPSLRPNPGTIGSQSTLIVLVDKTNTAALAAVRMAYAVVDTNYDTLYWGDADNVNKQFGQIIPYDASKFKTGTLYRLYYVIYDKITSQVYYKGHGDIQL